MLEVDPEQRNLLRFLWVDNIESDDPNFVTFRFCRLLFGLVSSPFGLNATVHNHIGKYEQIDPQFVREVIRSLYVDDFASGKNLLEGSFELYQKLKYRFREGGFNMRKWASNGDKLMEMIERQECELPSTVKTDAKLGTGRQKVTEDDESYSKVVLNNNVVCNESKIKVLGSTWNRESDKLKFDFSVITRNVGNAPLTKRVMLNATARFFDPLRLLSPIILPLKLMFQKACCQEIGWDDPLPNELYKELYCIIADLSKVSSIEIPRCLILELGNDIKSVQLHGFADASKVAYAPNIYIRVETSESVTSNLLTAKTKVALLKVKSVLRLELLSGVILSKLITSVSEALQNTIPIDSVLCWLDSQVALWWIYGEAKDFKQFAQNRAKKIRSLVNKELWMYCPSELNPSDIGSRGAKCSDLLNNELW